MASSLNIAHITDLHIAEDDSPVRNINVRQNFLRVLGSASSFRPDLIVLGGDLAAENGEVGAYQWIKSQLDNIEIPYLITPGNHDDVGNLASFFKSGNPDFQSWDVIWKDDNVIVMGVDSSKGVITDQQLHWMHKTAKTANSPILLFMHYPPLNCGCRFMDAKYPLTNKKDVFNVIAGCNNISAVFCGHYHTEKTLVEQDKAVFLTPSTMMQMSQTNPSYEIESLRPGWRWIEFKPSGLSTRVIYPD